jgi:hypothetical protein
MTKDDITSMARKAGFVGFDGENKCLREFAALVAAAQREEIAKMVEDWDSDSADPRDIAAAIRARGRA